SSGLGRFLDIDPSSRLESHTKGRTTSLGADQYYDAGSTDRPLETSRPPPGWPRPPAKMIRRMNVWQIIAHDHAYLAHLIAESRYTFGGSAIHDRERCWAA
ncbi:hypothetical protein, partial [Methylobacterium sp. yr668]|uniref:hypothetical protein n=1 Tax=Methylobacterium sp. yr668 TaxID=1761801 RepID=UPI001AEC919A